jgi:RNA polymerase sigma-70 factor (ECF subfamily)
VSAESPTFDELLRAARAGDRLAQNRLFETFQQFLRLTARRALAHAPRPKFGESDLIQDTLTRAYERLEQFTGSGEVQFQAWLHVILNHTAANLARRFGGTAKRDYRLEVALPGGALGDLLPSQRTGPLQKALNNEKQARVERALAALPEGDRELVRLRSQMGLSFAGIADYQGRTVDAVRKQWSRAVRLWADEVKRLEGPVSV